jgi:hypothetical protein
MTESLAALDFVHGLTMAPAGPNIALHWTRGKAPRASERQRSAQLCVMQISRIIVIAALVALEGCSRAPVVTIANRSTVTLSNIVISGSGFSNRIDRIAGGGEHRLTVHPRGESGVRLAFDAGGQHVDSGEQGYFEASGGYRVIVTVNTNLSVSVSSDLSSY